MHRKIYFFFKRVTMVLGKMKIKNMNPNKIMAIQMLKKETMKMVPDRRLAKTPSLNASIRVVSLEVLLLFSAVPMMMTF